MSDPRPAPPPGALFRLAAGFYLFLAVGGLVWIGWRDGTIRPSLFVPVERWWLDVAAGLGVGVGIVGAWRALRRWSELARRLDERLGEALGPLDAGEAGGLALLSAVAEEVFFRGAMQPSWGLWPTTLVFALLHSGRGRELAVWFGSAFAAGALLGGLAEWRENLLAPILAHGVLNGLELRRLATRSS